ncbi:MAG: hypothetical protein GWM92_15100, partial [Gemmatimonadetes bacterium]|nr:hypothetical protein [Gemmatimonadota bacterium]NIR80077.1 hypothetical protein [Gemmatimonadota bacterium]NIT88815.1 hypothetical protein [Gemmatimonadota bacterium]NIU32619.1 hypothetical protein [Gemmatimonadota bacterium]NIU37072.1 hypothetical protein [Gemmatimonadota bacterium]
MVRYGSELGWERTRPSAASLAQAAVVGHHHPESRQYVPPGEVFADPTGVAAEGWSLETERPRSAYAPSYAPRMAALPFQVGRFRRGDTLVVAAGFALPDSTPSRIAPAAPGRTHSPSARGFPNPSPESPGLPSGPPEAGLILLSSDGSRVARARVRGRSSGAAAVRAPAGRYLASVEVWSPGDARAARGRQGVSM